MDVVFARHKEPLNWAGYLSRLPGVRVFVFNDGPPMEDEVAFKGFRIFNGDGRPAESGKYLKFIIDNFDSLSEYTVFSQADPFEHSPDFTGLLARRDLWAPVQNLTYRYLWEKTEGVPREDLVEEGEDVSRNFIGGFRQMDQEMDADLRSTNPLWADSICERLKFAMWDEESAILTQFARKFGFRPAQTLRKGLGACFAVRRDQIRKHPKKFYENLLEWYLSEGADDLLAIGFAQSTFKTRAILLEFLWLAIFDAEPDRLAETPQPPPPPPPAADGPMARLRRRMSAYSSSSSPSSSPSDTRVTSLPLSSSSDPPPLSDSSSSSVSLTMKLPMLLPESVEESSSASASDPDSQAESSSSV